MSKYSFNTSELLSIISFLLGGAIVYSNINENLSLTSLLISLSFIFVFCAYFLNHRYINKKLNSYVWSCIIISIFNVTVNYLGGFEYYKKVIMFSASLIWMITCISIHIRRRTSLIIGLINVGVSLLYLIYYKKGFTLDEGQILLTFNFSNSNQAGMFLLNSSMYLTLFLLTDIVFKKKRYRLIFLPLAGIILYFTFLTGCRSSFGAYAFFLILCSLDYLSFLGYKIKKKDIWIWALSPLLFVFIYVIFIQSVNLDLSFGMESGKTNDTRLGLWVLALDRLPSSLFFGDYYNIHNVIGFSHLHNVHLDVLICYGLVPFILYVVALFRTVCITLKNSTFRSQRLSLYAFCACFVSGFFEASLVSGSAGLFLFSFGFLIFANQTNRLK